MCRLFLVSLFFLCHVSAFAQEATDVRFYVVPSIGSGASSHDARRPKYIADWSVDHPGETIAASMVPYGLNDVFLVAADVTPTQHTTLAANLDVIAIPQNLDAQISLTALATVQQKLEGLQVPSAWVTTSHTYRDVLRVVRKLFAFMGRFHLLEGRTFFEAGITLDTRINQLSQAQRSALTAVAADFGLDVSGITGTMLVRQALKLLADQLPEAAMKGEPL